MGTSSQTYKIIQLIDQASKVAQDNNYHIYKRRMSRHYVDSSTLSYFLSKLKERIEIIRDEDENNEILDVATEEDFIDFLRNSIGDNIRGD